MRERDPSDQETREREADNLIKSPIRSNSNFHPFSASVSRSIPWRFKEPRNEREKKGPIEL